MTRTEDQITAEDIDSLVQLAKSLPNPITPVELPCEGCGDTGPWYIVATEGPVPAGEIRGSEILCADCLLERLTSSR